MATVTSGIAQANGVQYLAGQDYYDKVQTNFFLDNMPDALNTSTVLLDKIEKTTRQTVSGRYIMWPVLKGQSLGVANVGYGSVIPDPGYRGADMAGTISRKMMMRIALDGDTIRHGKTNGGAYMEAQRIEMEGVMNAAMLNRARQVHNDGSGRIGTLKALTASAAVDCVFTMQVNTSIEGAATTRGAGTLENYIENNMCVAFCTSAATMRLGSTVNTNQTGFFVRDIAISGNDVTFKLSLTPGGAAILANTVQNIAANDWIVVAGVVDASNLSCGVKHEILGIGGIFSDTGVIDGMQGSATQQSMTAFDVTTTSSTYFQGILCSSNLYNQGIVLDNSGIGNRPLTEALLQQAVSDAERINNANVEFLLSHPYTYDSYVALLVRDKRYQNTTDLGGGHTSLSFNGLKWVKDRFCYQNRVYGLALSGQIEICETSPLAPLNAGDVTTWERVTNQDKYSRGWVRDDQLIVSDIRNRCGFVLTELVA